MDACVFGAGGAAVEGHLPLYKVVHFLGQDEVDRVAVLLRREGGEGFLFRGDISRVDVAGEEAVGKEDFRVGGGGGAVDVEHREVL